jgi:hypothetical protein
MALTKEIIQDKIEVIGEHKFVQIRTATVIKEDGVEINRSFHRHILDCVSSEKNEDNTWTHADTDISSETSEVQGICNAVWTTTVKNAKKAYNEANG